MARFERKQWSELSPDYRARLERKGITRADHAAGVSISKARGHDRKFRGQGVWVLTTKGEVKLAVESLTETSKSHSNWTPRSGRRDILSRIGSHWNGIQWWRRSANNPRAILDALEGYGFKGSEISQKTGALLLPKNWILATSDDDVFDLWFTGQQRFEDMYT